MGFYDPQTQNIHIPAIWLAALIPWYKERCMVDVLRHEFGHALEGRFYKFFHDERFKNAFGGEYGENKVAKSWDERNYVSEYARKMNQEDFAETFMLFVKHKGIIPRQFARSKAIRVKWEAVSGICLDIDYGDELLKVILGCATPKDAYDECIKKFSEKTEDTQE